MKRTVYMICLAAVLISAAAGCAKKGGKAAPGYQIYCTNQEHSRLLTETYSLQNAENPLDALMEKFASAAQTVEHCSALPAGVRIEDYALTDGQLTVTFDDGYLQLDNSQEILLRAGLVLTMTQLPDVRTVVFHIGEDVLKDSAGEPVGAMTGSMFINNPVGINSYQYASLSLYFSNRTGDKIVREMRNVHYSSNTTLERVVMEQLLKGPMNEQLLPVLGTDVTILGITREEDSCTVNFSKEFLNVRNDSKLRPEVTIYSIVDSLCDMLNVSRVQIQVEGESNVLYKETLSLNGPFHRSSEWIETVESTERENDAQGSQPSIGL